MTTSNIVAPSFGAHVPQHVAPPALVIDERSAATTTLASSGGGS